MPIASKDAFYNDATVVAPPQLYSHLTQTKQAQSVHAENNDAKGVLGSMMDSLVNQDEPYASRSWSICGQMRIVQGSVPPTLMQPWSGVETYKMFPELGEQFLGLADMTHTSLFGETFAGLLQTALLSSEYLKPIIDAAMVSDDFPTTVIGKQLQQGTFPLFTVSLLHIWSSAYILCLS
jgi:hypothetical protein